jgi:hypothetical protein
MESMISVKTIIMVLAYAFFSSLMLVGCSKKPNAIGPDSVLINAPDGKAYIYNPDNGALEQQPSREAGMAKLPWDATRELNPGDPTIQDALKHAPNTIGQVDKKKP